MPEPPKKKKRPDFYHAPETGYGKPKYAQALSARELEEYRSACGIYAEQIDNVRTLGKKDPNGAIDKLYILANEYKNVKRPVTDKDPVYIKMRDAASEIFQGADSEAQKKMHKKVKELEEHFAIMLAYHRREARA